MAVYAGFDVAVVAAHVDERELNEQPEGTEAEEGAQGYCCARCLRPDEEIEEKDCREEKTRKERRGDHGVVLPI